MNASWEVVGFTRSVAVAMDGHDSLFRVLVWRLCWIYHNMDAVSSTSRLAACTVLNRKSDLPNRKVW